MVDETIRAAIAERRLISFEVGGKSGSGAPLGWRTAVISKVSGIKVLERRFAGPRPAPSGRHKHWDELIASVSRS